MKIIDILIFFLVLLCFLHFQKCRKTCNDLEILSLEEVSKDKLELVCGFKQPVCFHLENEILIQECSYDTLIKDPLLKQLVETLSDINYDTLQQTRWKKLFHDDFLAPSCFSFEKWMARFSLLIGEKTRPFQYSISSRHYLIVNQGNLTVTLVPPKEKKHMDFQTDYFDLLFKSEKEGKTYMKVEMVLGDILMIPPLWGYSTTTGKETSVSSIEYKTIGNIISFLDYYFIQLLQKMNTQYKINT